MDVFHLREQLVEDYREYVEFGKPPALTMQRRATILDSSAPRWISPLGLWRGFAFGDVLRSRPGRCETVQRAC